MSIESVMPSNHLILCHPLLLLPPIPPSVRVFSNESALRIRWPKDWSFSFSIDPSHGQSGLISFGTGWLDLLAVQVPWKRDYEVQEMLCVQLSALVLVFSARFYEMFPTLKPARAMPHERVPTSEFFREA